MTSVETSKPDRSVSQETPARDNSIMYFLHMGKAAHSQIGLIVDRLNARRAVEDREAWPRSSPNIFRITKNTLSVRDLSAGDRSEFYSSLWMGQPKLFNGQSKTEAIALPHENDLAEALFQPGKQGRNAVVVIRQ